MQNGYLPIDVKFADRAKYYACFDAYFRGGNAEMMTSLVAEYVKLRLQGYLTILEEDM